MRGTDPFKDAGTQLEEIQATREQLAFAAFSMLEERLGDFSKMLIMSLGDRTRAVWWMSMRQRNLDGRNAYQALADGEQDRLWDILESLCRTPPV